MTELKRREKEIEFQNNFQKITLAIKDRDSDEYFCHSNSDAKDSDVDGKTCSK